MKHAVISHFSINTFRFVTLYLAPTLRDISSASYLGHQSPNVQGSAAVALVAVLYTSVCSTLFL